MRIHILSDLHHEFSVFQPSITDADLTILAGDIDVKARGPAWALSAFSGNIVMVCGNHEFYGGHLTRTLEKLKSAECHRLKILQREVWIISGLRILGTTGWTDFGLTGDVSQAQQTAWKVMQDYTKIRHGSAFHRLRPDTVLTEAQSNYAWLQPEIAKPFPGKTIVVTHLRFPRNLVCQRRLTIESLLEGRQ